MSTNKTTNYELHSWVPQDDFLLTEINQNFTALDSVVGDEVSRAQLSENALATAVAARAQVVIGSYTGQGSNSRIIELGFCPLAVMLFTREGMTCHSSTTYGGLFFSDHPLKTSSGDVAARIYDGTTEKGFVVYGGSKSTDNSGKEYYYIAFR